MMFTEGNFLMSQVYVKKKPRMTPQILTLPFGMVCFLEMGSLQMEEVFLFVFCFFVCSFVFLQRRVLGFCFLDFFERESENHK